MEAPREQPVQYFSDEYLKRCRQMKPEEIVQFLENFRLLHGGERTPSKRISVRVPGTLLEVFRQRCRLEGVRYQTQIKRLMSEWLGAAP